MNKIKLIAGSVLILNSFLPALVYCAGVASIDPLKIDEQLLPGETKEGKIRLTNAQKETMEIKIYVNDWTFTPQADGTKNFTPPGLLPSSSSRWVHLYPDKITLRPGDSKEIRYTISVPPDATGGYQSVIFFENLLSQAERKQGTSIDVSGRIACLVYLEVIGTVQKEGIVRSLKLQRSKGSKSLALELTFENTGNSHLIMEPVFNLLSAQGTLAARGVFPKTYTLPGDSPSISAEWLGNLPAGEYDLILTIDLGEDQILVREWRITVSEEGEIEENLT